MLKRLITFLLFGLHLTSAVPQTTYKTDTIKLNYLITNRINLQDSLINWDLVFDSTFYEKDIYWLGEAHGTKYSYDALWIIFKHIHEKVKFKYFLIEAGYPAEFYINKYLDTGNEQLLITCFENFKGGYNYNQDLFDFYRRLYTYNQSLDATDRIIVVALDYIQNNFVSSRFLRSLLLEHVQCLELLRDANKFINKPIKNTDRLLHIYDELYTDLLNDKSKYIKCLDSSYFAYQYTLRNITSSWISELTNFLDVREVLMFDNFKIRNQDLNFKKNKAFAYFGSSHCYLEKTKGFESFSSRIKKSNPRLSIVSIIMMYAKSKTRAPVNTTLLSIILPDMKTYINWPFSNNWNIPSKLWADKISLINLNKDRSPFQKSKWFIAGSLKEYHTTDYFQYIVFIKNSPAAARIQN